jgi:hypothetical protein
VARRPLGRQACPPGHTPQGAGARDSAKSVWINFTCPL